MPIGSIGRLNITPHNGNDGRFQTFPLKNPGVGVWGPIFAMVNAPNGRDVATKLTYITPTSKFNRRYVAPGEEINTGVYEDKNVTIRDARPKRQEFTLDKNGFALFEHHSKVSISWISLTY